MSLIQVCVLGTFSLALCKAVELLLRRTRGIDLDGPHRGNWLTGNMTNIFEGGIDYCVNLAEKYGGAVRLQGPFGEEIYVSDPLALYHILVKDQHIFEEPGPFISSNKIVFGEGLIATIGEQHRRQRKLLNPVFSTSNMRQLLATLQPIAGRLTSTLASKLPTNGSHKEIDVLPWLSRSALDSVCQAILGYPSNTLLTAESDVYAETLRTLGPLIGVLMRKQPLILLFMTRCSPYWARKVLSLVTASWLPSRFVKDLREFRLVIETMDSGSQRAFKEKKAALETEKAEPSSQAKDIMDIMLKANSATSSAERLTDAELLGQMNVMVFAGLDTTTAALARCVYLLAEHPRAQARLRSEIREAMKLSVHKEDDDVPSVELPYDVLMSLPFLDGVVKETLRLYPSLPNMVRQTTKATVVPLHFPARSRSGAYTSAVALPQGTHTVISVIAANRNRGMWGDDANEWRPERWLSSPAPSSEVDVPFGGENTASASKSSTIVPGVKDGMRYPGVYSNMMTFLGGGRSCIGFKFAEMEIKQVLASLMLSLHFALPTEPNAQGHVKEIQWKLRAFHIPVVKPPAGDGMTAQVPLNLRLVTEDDFVWVR